MADAGAALPARLGSTDLEVSRHGFGAARIGGAPLDRVEALFDSFPDRGITFIDTADCQLSPGD